MIVGGDSKRHRICHPCVKAHLATGRTREHRVSRTVSCHLSAPRERKGGGTKGTVSFSVVSCRIVREKSRLNEPWPQLKHSSGAVGACGSSGGGSRTNTVCVTVFIIINAV